MKTQNQIIQEAYANMAEAAKDPIHSDIRNTLSARGWKAYNPYESIKTSYSLESPEHKNNENKLHLWSDGDSKGFTHTEPNGMIHKGPMSAFNSYLAKYHKK